MKFNTIIYYIHPLPLHTPLQTLHLPIHRHTFSQQTTFPYISDNIYMFLFVKAGKQQNLENRKSCEYPEFVQIKLKKLYNASENLRLNTTIGHPIGLRNKRSK